MTSLIHKIKMHGIRKLIRYAHIEARAKGYRLVYGSMSQSQEDLMIARMLTTHKSHGFYVDIGAACGVLYSNTYYFYRLGWRGINIEPDPDNFTRLMKNRPLDVNVPMGVGEEADEKTLFRFSPGVLSTFSQTAAEEFKAIGYSFVGKTKVKVNTLAQILDTYSPPEIDFFSIDTEGWDLEVLQSNDWTKYRPKLICVELEHTHREQGKRDDEMHTYLARLQYQLRFDNRINRIYERSSN